MNKIKKGLNPLCKACGVPYTRNTKKQDKLCLCKNCKETRRTQQLKTYFHNRWKKLNPRTT